MAIPKRRGKRADGVRKRPAGKFVRDTVDESALERWRSYRQGFDKTPGGESSEKSAGKGKDRTHSRDDDYGL